MKGAIKPDDAARALERRESARVDARLVLELRDADRLGETVTTESINLSSKGLYCHSNTFLSPLTKVSVNIIIPPFGRKRKYHALQADGMVVRCESTKGRGKAGPYQMACYFTSLSKRDERFLAEYVDWKLVRRALEANQEVVLS
jgi:hypothetical protein